MEQLGEWLLDDWAGAWRRSMIRSHQLSPAQMASLRAQRRIGQVVKGLLLGLALLLLVMMLGTDDRALLRRPLALWGLAEAALLAAQVLLGWRSAVSYGWALHHSKPRILNRRLAQRDLRVKGTMAVVALAVGIAALVV